jgi:hypothetical protein
MGVVIGQIKFLVILRPYDFFKAYCKRNNIAFEDYPDDRVISIRTIETLKIANDKGEEIKGLGNQISGMDSDSYELTIEGIPYPFYEDEFPHHVKSDEERFK